MDEYEAIVFLTDVSFESRFEAIRSLHGILKTRKGKDLFSDYHEISRGLAVALCDTEIDVRISGLNFAHDFISHLDEGDESCIQVLIPAIMTCLLDSRAGVLMTSIKALKLCLKKSVHFESSLEKIISEGINSQNVKACKTVMSKIHLIVDDHKKDKDISTLVCALFQHLNNKSLQSTAFASLKKLKSNVNDKTFGRWCSDVPENTLKLYQHLSGNVKDSNTIDSLMKVNESSKQKDFDFDYSDEGCDAPGDERDGTNNSLKFGFLTVNLYNQLINSTEKYEKENVLERIRISLEKSHYDKSQLHYFPEFVDFLMHQFDSSNMRVNTICIEIIQVLIGKFGSNLISHMRFLFNLLFPHICSVVPTFKEDITNTLLMIFKEINVKQSCSALLEFMNHSRSKLRQEALNLMICVLLTLQLEERDLKLITPVILKTLLDPKRFVRQAALECTSVLDSQPEVDREFMNSKLSRLESSPSGHGVTRAVEERLRMAELPERKHDGTVEYVVVSNKVVLEWILLAGDQGEVSRSVSIDEFERPAEWAVSDHKNRNDARKSLSRLTWNMSREDQNDHQCDEMRIQEAPSSASISKYEPFLHPINRPPTSSGSMGRKFFSAGQADRMLLQDGGQNNNHNHEDVETSSAPYSPVDSVSSSISSATFPHIRKRVSAGRNRVHKLFDMLERKEIDAKKFPKERVVEEEMRCGQSKRVPVKANMEHRLLLEKTFEREFQQNTNGNSRDQIYQNEFFLENDGEQFYDQSEENELRDDVRKLESKTFPGALLEKRLSTPTPKTFPGRSEYPMDHFNPDDAASKINTNSNNSYMRRPSVIKLEMPESLLLSNKPDCKDVPNNFRTSKPLRSQNSISKKMEEKHLEEKPEKPLPINDLIDILNSADDWKKEVASLEMIGQMCQTNPDVVVSQLHPAVHAVVKEINNLRSNVARAAMKCLSEMFKYMQSDMEPVLDNTLTELLNKTSHTNNFMKQAAIECLQDVVENVSFSKSLDVLIRHGTHNKNALIRSASSQLVVMICEMLGPHGVLCGKQRDVSKRLLFTISQFLTDGSPDVRASGRKIFLNLRCHEQFERLIREFLPVDIINRNIEPLIRGHDSKGNFELTTSVSAHQRTTPNRNYSFRQSRHHSAGNLCGVGAGGDENIEQNSTIKVKKQKSTKIDDATLDNIFKIIQDLGASDYRQRCSGINELKHLILSEGKVNAVGSRITKIFDKFVPCLKDSNFKVSIQALNALNEILPHLAPHMTSVVNMTVSTVASNLASNNREVCEGASAILETLSQSIDPAHLLPSFVSSTTNANARYKTKMIEKVSELLRQMKPQHQKLVSLHVLPLLWQLLSNMTVGGGASSTLNSASYTKKVTTQLALDLREIMGDNLILSASMNSKVNSSMKQILEDMLHQNYNSQDY